MERYFGVHIDKQYQKSFTLDAELIDDQIMYAALDTRFPFAIKKLQKVILSGRTNHPSLSHLDPLIMGDNLEEIADIENDAIGAFQDMHIHGENLDTDKWMRRVERLIAELEDLIKNTLDPIFSSSGCN